MIEPLGWAKAGSVPQNATNKLVQVPGRCPALECALQIICLLPSLVRRRGPLWFSDHIRARRRPGRREIVPAVSAFPPSIA
jgi:hypothetical protein